MIMLFVSALSACTAAKSSIVILEDGHGTGFTINIKEYNSKNTCEMPLNEGDVLQIEVVREDGEISLVASGKKGSEPYGGNDLRSGIFTVTVSETDEYVFKVSGKSATGRITVKNLGSEAE